MNQVDATRSALISNSFAIMTALARAVTLTDDASLRSLTRQVGARVANLTLDSDPDEIRATIDMLDGLNATMDRLARDIDAETAAA